jgi:hypothetical protein
MAQDYKILGQKPVTNINPAGTGFSNDWEVTYQVTSGAAKGTVATVTIPQADHNAEYVDSAIREKLSDLHGIAELGSSS